MPSQTASTDATANPTCPHAGKENVSQEDTPANRAFQRRAIGMRAMQ
jgi:hypothetical protein